LSNRPIYDIFLFVIKNHLQTFLLKRVSKAIGQYKLLTDGDKILLGVSGGKDSMTLLRLLMLKKNSLPVKFDLVAAHVDFGMNDGLSQRLEEHFREIGVQYHIERAALPGVPGEKKINCFWCAWNRRKTLFTLAKKYGCSKVALAHHLDDVVETYLMNLFFHGKVSAMPAKLKMFNGEFDLIRPMVLIEEKSIREYVKKMNIPHSTCVCPFFENSKRKYAEDLIKKLEKECPQVRINLFRSMKRIENDFLI